MPQINLGTVANDNTGSPLRTGGQLINQYGLLGDKTVNAAFYKTPSITNEAALNIAIPAAAALGTGAAVWIPASMLPYNASLVSFNPAVRMTAEGGDPGLLHGLAYGMATDGSADVGPGMQAMVNYATRNALGPGGPEIVLPAGILAWNTTVNCYTANANIVAALKIRGQGNHGTIIRPTIAPMLLVGGTNAATSTTYGFTASDFNIELTSNLYYADALIHLRLCVQWHLARIGLISGTNPAVDLYTYAGYLFNLDSSYLGIVERCWANGKGVYLFELNDFVDPNQQTDTVTFINCYSAGMALGLIHAPTGATDDHNFHFITPKHIMISGWAEANVSIETTLSSSPSAGGTSFTVTSATGLATGSFIWVGTGASIELVYISNLTGTTVTCPALRFAHTSGNMVLMGGFMASTAPKSHGIWFDHPHCEFSAMCALIDGTANVRISDLYGLVKEQARVVTTTATKNLVIERGEWHWSGVGNQYAIRVTTAGDSANHGPVFIYGPCIDPNTGNPPATLYQNDAGGSRPYVFTNVLNGGTAQMNRQDPSADFTVIDTHFAGGAIRYERTLVGTLYSISQLGFSPGPADGATITPDASLGNYQRLVLGGSRTIAAPLNPPASGRAQQLTFEAFNNTGGAITTTWNAIYVLQAAWVDAAAGKSRQITFNYNYSRNKWVEATRTTADT